MLMLVAVQVLLLNHVHLWGYASPLLLPLFLAFMPLGASRCGTQLWAFSAGMIVDVFSNTPGVGSGAMTFAALLQPTLLELMVPKDAPEDLLPNCRTMGRWNHFRYVALIFILHHTVYFALESFSFFHLKDTLISLVSSLALSVSLAWMIESVRGNERRKV